jgi:hypothetical protein
MQMAKLNEKERKKNLPIGGKRSVALGGRMTRLASIFFPIHKSI